MPPCAAGPAQALEPLALRVASRRRIRAWRAPFSALDCANPVPQVNAKGGPAAGSRAPVSGTRPDAAVLASRRPGRY